MTDEKGNEIAFMGITPKNISENWMVEALAHFQTANDYIGHVRQLPLRDYRLNDGAYTLMGTKGENAYEFLISDVVSGNGNLLTKVSNWYKKVFDGWAVVVDQSRAPSYSVELQNKNVRNNILDTGAGIGQSLPEIVAIAKACENHGNTYWRSLKLTYILQLMRKWLNLWPMRYLWTKINRY